MSEQGGESSPDTVPPRRDGRAKALLQWWVPSLLLTALALGQVFYLRGLVEQPRRLAIFFYLFRTQELGGALSWLVILVVSLVAALAVRRAPDTARLMAWLDRNVRVIGLVVLALLVAGTQLVYRNFPLAMDEYAAVFQAEAFAAGELTGRFPPGAAARFVPPFFLDHFFYAGADGRIVAAYWPTYALMLAPLAKIGTTWLLNPLLTVGSFWSIVSLARRLGGGATAGGWAALLCLASPVLWINGISYYSMPAHLFFNLAFARMLLDPRGWRLPAAGLLGSIALTLHQPVPHLLFALPWGLWLLRGKGGIARILLVGVGYLPLSLLLGVGWMALRAEVRTGDPASLLASFRADDASDASTIEGEAGVAPGTSREQVIPLYVKLPSPTLLWIRVFNASKEWLWTAPTLALLALLGAIAAWRRRTLESGRTFLLLFAASLAVTFVGYLFVPFDQGHGWGYRYLFSAWAALPLLAAAWLATPAATASNEKPRLLLAVAVAALLAVPTGNLLRAAQVRSFIDTQRRQAPPLHELPADSHWVFFLDPLRGYYRGDLVRNDPLLRGHVWMLVSRGRRQDEALIGNLFPSAELYREQSDETLWRVSRPAPATGAPDPGR